MLFPLWRPLLGHSHYLTDEEIGALNEAVCSTHKYLLRPQKGKVRDLEHVQGTGRRVLEGPPALPPECTFQVAVGGQPFLGLQPTSFKQVSNMA